MRVAVIGAGISGLTAADRLQQAGAEVVLIDGGEPGGKLRTVEVAGVSLDSGAESALVRGGSPTVAELITELGLELVRPTGARPKVLIDGHPADLPAQVLGVPSDLDQLDGVLTQDGVRRARLEPELPAPPLPADVPIGRIVDERFGPEVTDRLLEPLLGGVYAGHARELSFASVSPALFERVRGGGSLSGHARDLTAGPRRGSPFVGTPGGMGALATALLASLLERGVELRRSTVRQIIPQSGRWQLTCGPVPTPEMIMVDQVVVATPAPAAARLLADVAPVAADQLSGVDTASVAVITLIVDQVELVGSGLLVPPGMLPTIKAFTHSDLKWDWVGERVRAAHGPTAHVVRASIGRARGEQLLQLSDHDLVTRTVAEAKTLPGWSDATVLGSHVQRWGGSLPQYAVGHAERMQRVAADVAAVPGLAVCGAYLNGMGIAACLRTAQEAAEMIIR